jgi:hypothetical protein
MVCGHPRSGSRHRQGRLATSADRRVPRPDTGADPLGTCSLSGELAIALGPALLALNPSHRCPMAQDCRGGVTVRVGASPTGCHGDVESESPDLG